MLTHYFENEFSLDFWLQWNWERNLCWYNCFCCLCRASYWKVNFQFQFFVCFLITIQYIYAYFNKMNCVNVFVKKKPGLNMKNEEEIGREIISNPSTNLVTFWLASTGSMCCPWNWLNSWIMLHNFCVILS